jgi:hypothetical protein
MNYRYTIDVLAEDGRSLESTVVAPDWNAAVEWAHFEGIRTGRLPAVTGTSPSRIEPIWDARAGEPIVTGFRIVMPSASGGELARDIPRSYLRSIAQDLSAGLVKKKLLEPGDAYRWTVSAFPFGSDATAADAVADDFLLEDVPKPLPVDDASLGAFLGGSSFVKDGDGDGGAAPEVPVFLPQEIMDEAVALARQAGDVETGGVLVGKLHRDRDAANGTRELFLEVTAQIPAQHTVSDSSKLTFTADTWSAVRAAIALRRRDELMLGWWHYHPDFCRLRGCPPERRRACDAASPFFSAEDVRLHATCFPAGYHVALLISDSSRADDLARSLFGWSQGMVLPRGFHVLGGTTDATTPASTT